MQDEYLTVDEVAKMLKVTVTTVRRRVKDGTLQGFKIGGILRITRSSIDRLIAQQTKLDNDNAR